MFALVRCLRKTSSPGFPLWPPNVGTMLHPHTPAALALLLGLSDWPEFGPRYVTAVCTLPDAGERGAPTHIPTLPNEKIESLPVCRAARAPHEPRRGVLVIVPGIANRCCWSIVKLAPCAKTAMRQSACSASTPAWMCTPKERRQLSVGDSQAASSPSRARPRIPQRCRSRARHRDGNSGTLARHTSTTRASGSR
jgi:hypothetical protein